MHEKTSIIRRYDLDRLRVLAILVVFCYHSLRFFNIEYWVIKNPTTYQALENLANYIECWMMPLIFVVSGASIFFESLKNKPVRKFIKDKALRLLVPLVVGIFTHALLQVYLERLSHGDFSGSLWTFLPHYFEGLYGFGGNFAWMGLHLWYLEVLFIFSIIFLPGLLLLRRDSGQRLIHKLGDILATKGAVYVLALVAILSWKLLDPDTLWGSTIFGWPLGVYFSFFLVGYLLVSNERLGQSIQRLRWFSFFGVLASTVIFFLTQDHGDLVVWSMTLACLGFARQHLNSPAPFLDFSNQAVLPFYILHQPVLILVGFFVVQWQIPDLLKYLVIALPAFLMTLGLYQFLVHQSNLLRFLFGMKPKQLQPSTAASSPLDSFNKYIFSVAQKISLKGILK